MNYEKEEFFAPGHGMCAGCAAPIIVRWVLKLAGPNTIVVNATGCLEVATTAYPRTSWRVPWMHVAFENAAAAASGIEAAAKVKGEKLNIIAFGGDGGTADIGFQALSGMVERGHNVLYVLYDNEAYMNTGIQRSGATPWGAWTTTSKVGNANPIGKLEPKKPMARIIAAHNAKYVATANPAFFQDFKKKVQKALSYEGPKFLHVISSCTTGWRHDPSKTIEIMKLATDTGLFPLWEVIDGDLENMRITYKPKKFKPIEEYLKPQGRFRHLLKNPEYVKKIQEQIDAWWAKYGHHYHK
ncbi:pyruvate ferredoxin oxidoreductase [Euryarchaeota archaeon ex4484_178]|nr:MAG: pyruvate ferredoxin oxidoreductase [Euryarchaeota archaeon ex4484_178]